MRINQSVFLCLLTGLLSLQLRAQSVFTVALGGAEVEYANAMTRTSDGGFVVTGWSNGMPYPKISLLAKFDANGDTVWTKTMNYLLNEESYNIIETADHGLLVVGEGKYCVASNCGTDAFAVRLNAAGDVLWSKGYGELYWDKFTDAVELPGGELVFAGETASIGAGVFDLFLQKTTANGDTLWHRSFGGAGQDYCGGVVHCADGGFLLAGGYRDTAQFIPSKPILIKTNASGDLQWAKTYDPGVTSKFQDLILLNDGYLAMYEKGLVRTDLSGNLLWAKSYAGFTSWVSQNTYAKLVASPYGGYLISGRYDHSGDQDACLLYVDAQGDPIWMKYFGESGQFDFFADVDQLSDGRIVAVGGTNSYGNGDTDALVVTMDRFGSLGSCEKMAQMTASTPSLAVASVTPFTDHGLWTANAGFVARFPVVPPTMVCQGAVAVEEAVEEAKTMVWLRGDALALRFQDQFSPSSSAELRLLDLGGRVLGQWEISSEPSEQYLPLPTHAAGIYLVTLASGAGMEHFKIYLP